MDAPPLALIACVLITATLMLLRAFWPPRLKCSSCGIDLTGRSRVYKRDGTAVCLDCWSEEQHATCHP